MDEKLQAAMDALLEIRDSAHSSGEARRIAQKALTKIWCDYYRYTHKTYQTPPLPARMLG